MSTTALNALSRASSAYLRSAMHQPIRWNEWGEEAFAIAQRENKPILLDIGAVWCHWCHVMDRESYDDPDIAQIVNERFVAVKVDRDERPDIDSRYQVAVSSISGQGGWPLTAFLTPTGKPFFGGTYFPPDDGYGRPSFRRVLLSISDAYKNKNADVMEQSELVEAAIHRAESFTESGGEFSPHAIDEIVEACLKAFDQGNGGFGQAPKFPHPGALDLLIDQYARTGREELRNVFITSLEKMARGGIYDQLAGGFHRYSVDERWGVPHFEKMSYDNSELLKNYVHAFQVTGKEFFADIARDICRWMDEWLSDRERGGFYASQDADYSMDDDGDYFTWTLDEVRSVVSEDEAAVVCLHYDVNEVGEMHHNPAKNVLYIRASLEEVALRLKLSPERARELLNSAREKMYKARLQRPTPYIDKTIYTGWNALCVSAYLQAASALRLVDTRHFALRSLDRILSQAWDNDRGLKHVIAYSDPAAEPRNIAGVLDDYAFTAVACIDAYEATADISYYNFAQHIADMMIALFFDGNRSDGKGGGFFDTQKNEGQALGVLNTRRKPFQDSPTPAGNSMAAIALLRLYAYAGRQSYRETAEQTLGLLTGMAGQFGLFAATYGTAGVHLAFPHTQIVVVGEDALAEELYAVSARNFRLNASFFKFSPSQAVEQNLPAVLAETLPHLPAVKEGRSLAMICSGMQCQPPVFSVEELNQQLRRIFATHAPA